MTIEIRKSKSRDLNEVNFSDIVALAEETLQAKTGKSIEQTVTTPYLQRTPSFRDYWHLCVSDYVNDEGHQFGSFKDHLNETISSLEYDFGKGTKYTDLTSEQWKTRSEHNFLYYLFIPVLEAIVEWLGEEADTDFYVEYF